MIKTSGIYIKLTEYCFKCKKPDVNYWIAKTLIEKIDEFPDIYIDEIAYVSNTTPSSVTKFCKKIGYGSFKDMKNDIETLNIYGDGLKKPSRRFKASFNFSDDSSEEELIEYFLERERNASSKILELFDREQFKRISKKLDGKKELVILGSIYSTSCINFFREIFSLEGFTVFEVDRQAEPEMIKQLINEKDMTFIISLSGEWVIANQKWLREDIDAEMNLLTTNESNNINEIFNEVINLSSMEDFFQSNYDTQKIINLCFVLLIITLKSNK